MPFITHQGSGLGRSTTDIAKLAPQATLRDGLALWGKDVGSSQAQIAKWLQDLGLTDILAADQVWEAGNIIWSKFD